MHACGVTARPAALWALCACMHACRWARSTSPRRWGAASGMRWPAALRGAWTRGASAASCRRCSACRCAACSMQHCTACSTEAGRVGQREAGGQNAARRLAATRRASARLWWAAKGAQHAAGRGSLRSRRCLPGSHAQAHVPGMQQPAAHAQSLRQCLGASHHGMTLSQGLRRTSQEHAPLAQRPCAVLEQPARWCPGLYPWHAVACARSDYDAGSGNGNCDDGMA